MVEFKIAAEDCAERLDAADRFDTMRGRFSDRIVQFEVLDGWLVRTVSGANGRTYSHRCTREAFDAVARLMDHIQQSGEGTPMAFIARDAKLPNTQMDVALSFLKDRRIIDISAGRIHSLTVHPSTDAMASFAELANCQNGPQAGPQSHAPADGGP